MNKAKVYKGVACLEIVSKDGGKWWYQGGKLAYTPVLIKEMSTVRTGKLEGNGREIIATALDISGKPHLVVLNLPRTDIVGLKARGLWPRGLDAPHEKTDYTPWPEHTKGKSKSISLA